MRNLSKLTMGLLIGATAITPFAAQAQDRGDRPARERGAAPRGMDSPSAPRAVRERQPDRGPDRNSGWQQRNSGVDAGARQQMMEQRRQAIEQGRAAAAAVERPAPLPPSARVDSRSDAGARDRGNDGRDWRGDRAGGVRNDGRADEQRRRWNENRTGEGRTDTDRNRGRGDDARRGDRDGDRNRVGIDDRRDGKRDRDGRVDRNDRNNRDWNQRWSSDRRDWNRDRRDHREWDRNWRNDRRYSWQDYRTHNRSHYRLPRYQPPRWGLSYRRWYPGHQFDSWFYGSSYWIADSWSYRLPPAYGPYRWVRYYDDAVLVDVDTGEIIDIIYSFFW